jgi:hypothetical protein
MKPKDEIEKLADSWSDDYEQGANRDIAKRSYIAAYTQCQEDNNDEYRWTISEIFDACFPTLGKGVEIWAAIAKILIEQKENK